MGVARDLERTKADRRKLLSTSAVVAAHAVLFASLAVPRLHPIRIASAPVDVDLVGMPHWSHSAGADVNQVAVTPPKPQIAPPIDPPPPTLASEPAKVSLPAAAPEPAPQPESVVEMAARLIQQTNPSALVAQLIEPLKASSPPPPVVASAAAQADAGSAAACEIGGALQTALQASQPVQVALERVPRAAKSVANAIMLWDGRWVDATSVGGDTAIGPVKTAILQGVLSATPGCQQQPVTGPRFITVTNGPSTTLLAVGSGVWRWADLLDGSVAMP
jgi:hypothetical protein